MTELIPYSNRADGQDNVGSNHPEPSAFQDIAANLWSAPNHSSDKSAGAGLDKSNAAGADKSASTIPQDRIALIEQSNALAEPITDGPPGILTSLDGVPKSEVTVNANVVAVLPDNPHGLRHEQFILGLVDGTDVFVAHDLTYAPRVPLKEGDNVTLKGEWIPEPNDNDHGYSTIGVLHWTHHSENENKHPSGWIELNGKRYQ